MVHQVVLGLGSNVGERVFFLKSALSSIENQIGSISLRSQLYKTAAWGNIASDFFLNQVVVIETSLRPMELLENLLEIEQKSGRVRDVKWGDRCLDIDILFYANLTVESKTLTIPHPFIAERRFVLAPLYEILPDFTHPVSRKKVRELFDICEDKLSIELSTENDK